MWLRWDEKGDRTTNREQCAIMDDQFSAHTISPFLNFRRRQGKSPLTFFMGQFTEILTSLDRFLDAKNKKYGNSALAPLEVFPVGAKNTGIEQRINDKLSRIKNSTELRKNDIVDLAGYLVLLMKREGWTNFDEMID